MKGLLRLASGIGYVGEAAGNDNESVNDTTAYELKQKLRMYP